MIGLRLCAPASLAIVAVTIAGGAAVIIACQSTDEPRAGTPIVQSPDSGGSSGGTDAALPDAPIACGDAPATAGAFTKRALLAATADCAAYNACVFVNAATELRAATRQHASTRDEATRGPARDAWKRAMTAWSTMELFQFGPAASKALDPYQGRGLRTFVNPWPQASRCEIEKQIASREWEKAGIATVLPSGRGLSAVEYALFYPGVDTACLPGSPTGQAWPTFAPADLVKAKADYALAASENVLAIGDELRRSWGTEGDDFKAKLLAHEGYGSEQETLNVVGWAMFYVEKEVKDLKLASYAGVQATPPNPETPFAQVDIENVRTNLRAFQSIFRGCGAAGAGIGFDDWLIEAGHGALANDIVAAWTNAVAAADAFPPFGQATQAQFRVLYDAVKPLTDLLKTSLFGSASPLNLRLPASAASDTD